MRTSNVRTESTVRAESQSPCLMLGVLLTLALSNDATAPSTRCTVFSGLTIGTQNLGTFNVTDAGHCCDLCTADGRCEAWTWHAPPTSTCWLKSNTVDSGRPKDKHNHTCSGLRIGPRPTGLACLPPHDHYVFCDTTLPVEARVADLVQRINDSDKPNLLTARGTGGSGQHIQAIPALGVPGYYWGTPIEWRLRA